MTTSPAWFTWALLSAIFAELTAIFAKIGIQEIDSDFATLIRTAIIIVILALFLAYTGKLISRSAFRRRLGCSSAVPGSRP